MDAIETARIKERMEFEAGRKGPPTGFPKLPPIPAGRYTDSQFIALERQDQAPALFR